MFTRKNLLLLFVSVLLFSSCYKDSEFENTTSTATIPPEVLSEVTGSVLGYVYDEDNQPIANAEVKIYSASSTTDEFGVFTLDNVKLDQHGTYLTVEHPDFMLGSDFIYVHSGKANSRVQMIGLTDDNTFDASKDASVNIRGGGTISFQGNSIIDDQNNEYTGTVQVSSRLIAASDDNISDLMPGSLLAQDNRGATVNLGTAGMVAIELRSPSGVELNIKPGTSAKVSIPAELSSWPDEIPTWSFNEETGRWQEEGFAMLENGFYVFEVPHLSFWNCDYPFDLVSVSGRVVNTDGEPVITKVGVRSELYGVEYTTTDSDGFFSGKVPADENLEFFVYGIFYCSNKTFRKDLGPFSISTALEDFVVDRNLIPNIKGQVVCSGAAYSNATIVIEANDEQYVYNSINNGDFDFNPNLLCANLTTGFIWAYDNMTKVTSPKQPIDFENPGTYVLDVCEVICDFQVDVNYECNSTFIELSIVNPDGTYSYNWDSGETLDVIFVSAQTSDIYCVTVTEDNTGCELSLCQETSALSASIYPDECNSTIEVNINNGSAPFTVTNNTTGETMESNFSYIPFYYTAGGEYCFNIVDKSGCELTDLCVIADDPDIFQDFIEYNPFSCELNKYYFNTNLYNYAFVSGPQGSGNLDFDSYGTFINVAEIGYKDIWVEFLSPCGYQSQITTPFFEGLGFDATATNVSCATCTDAQITYTVDPLANCIDCIFGEVRIFDQDFMDVTTDNDNGMLGEGTYFVAALDQNNGCFIASQKIAITN